MGRHPVLPAQDKAKIVLSVLSKERTTAEAAREHKVSEQSIANWRKQFIEGGTGNLSGGAMGRSLSPEEQRLHNDVRRLKIALGEAYVELMALRKLGHLHHTPSKTSN